MTKGPTQVQLKPETVQAFEDYVHDAEAAMDELLAGSGPFLWAEGDDKRARTVRKGEVVAAFWSGQEPVKVPNGLIHDWIGAAFVPGATVEAALALVQDYDNHKNIYKPEVMDSKLVSHARNDFTIFLRLLKKKIITVVLDTYHDVHYFSVNSHHWICRSHTTQIREVEDAGTAKEKVLPADTGYGFLWRLYSYWQFLEKDRGVHLECRAISLSRDVPTGLGWIVDPIIRKLPRESLIHTLQATRQALEAQLGRTPST